jgi:N-acetylglucosamine kinase
MIYGIDIGGTKIETAIFDENLSVIESWRVPTPTQDYQAFLGTLQKQVLKADNLSGGNGILGIGMPGLLDASKRSLSANIPCAMNHNLQRDLENLIQRPLGLENDCRCFALSEANLGAGQHFEKVYGAVLGTGSAGGLCVGGKIYNGANGHVGEYGHIPLPAQLQLKYNLPLIRCGCGLMACMENYISGSGLKKLYNHYFGIPMSAEDIVAQYRQGDAKATQIFAVFTDLLGYTIASLVQHYDPDIIVFGGGLSKIEELYGVLRVSVRPYLFKTSKIPPMVRAAYGDSSGVRGAALLALQHLSNHKSEFKHD